MKWTPHSPYIRPSASKSLDHIRRLGLEVIVFGWFFVFGLIGVAGTAAQVAAPSPKKQPNILFIFTDDLAYQAISAYGEHRQLLQTPHLDRLAREGMRFDRALVPNSICGPSRATVLTGKYSHSNGYPNNAGHTVFDGSQPTFPKLLQKAGYQTSIIGKWHLGSDPTGFDHWQVLPGQGFYYQPVFLRNGERIVEKGYVTDVITDRSIEWLEKRDKSKPFLLMSQHKAPHREWEPALRHLNHDKDRQYPEPASLFDDYANRGLAVRDQDMTLEKTFNDRDAKLIPPPRLNPQQRKVWDAYYEPRNEAFRKANPQGKDLVRWRYNRYLHDYLATVKSVDESIGKLLKYLDDEGLTENTLVIFSSDQGFFLGEHGWFDKRWIFEESLRTPLLVRWPGVVPAGSVNKDLVSTLDLAQTFLEASHAESIEGAQGRSLLPVLQGKTPTDWRKSFYYHYYEYPVPHHVRPHYGVVTAQHKLVHFYGPDVNYWELYDLEQDPQELRSVYDQPEYRDVQKELHTALQKLRQELKVPDPDPPGYSGGQQTSAVKNIPNHQIAKSATPKAAKSPNIIIINADDLGYGDLGCFGAKRWTTPHLDKMATEGMRATRFYAAQPVCSASRSALLTGCYPSRIGIQGALPPKSNIALNPGEMTLAELVKQQRYATAAYGKWHLGDATPYLPIHHGFDEYFGLPYSNDMWPRHPGTGASRPQNAKKKRPPFPNLPLIEGDRVVIPEVTEVEQTRITTWYTQRAVQFIHQHTDQPFLIYLAHSMPHVPLFVSDKFAGKSAGGIYGDVIQEIDWSVGEILQALQETGLDQNTLVIFTSDNGPWLNYGSHSGLAGPLREGKGTVWEGGIRVPFVARWPGHIPAGAVVDQPFMNLDLLPTVAAITQSPLPAHKIDGLDITPLLTAKPEAKSPHPAYYFYYQQNELQAVMSGDWKLILPHTYRTLNGRAGRNDGLPIAYEQKKITQPELYNVVTDIGEQNNVYDQHPEIVARLIQYAESAREDLGDRLEQRHGVGIRSAATVEK